MTETTRSWLLLITNLPGRNAALRMRSWRALKAAGAGLMRDGAYVLPASKHASRVFNEQSAEILAAGGAAHVVAFDANSQEQQQLVVALFDRKMEYTEAMQRLHKLKDRLGKLSELDARQE